MGEKTAETGIAVLDGFSRYEILNTGIVKYRDSGKICPDYGDGKGCHRGYRKIKLYNDDGIRKCFSIHRLVWLAFFGEIPKGFEVDHIDRDRANNHSDNLRVIPLLMNRKKVKGRK